MAGLGRIARRALALAGTAMGRVRPEGVRGPAVREAPGPGTLARILLAESVLP